MDLPEPKASPLYPLLNQVNNAAENGLDLIAIGMAVALPHLCASLAMENGRAQGAEYKDWCRANIIGRPEFSYLSAEDLYSFRCGVLHQGRFGDLKNKPENKTVERVLFLPKTSGGTWVNNVFNDAYVYSVVEFCRNMCDAAYEWYEANRDDPIVKANSERMVQYHPEGLSPYIVGMGVIA